LAEILLDRQVQKMKDDHDGWVCSALLRHDLSTIIARVPCEIRNPGDL